MPSLQVCAQRGCPVLVTHGRCAEHRRVTDRRYGSQKWRLYSQDRLSREPFCVDCGCLAEVTDHVLSVRTHPHLFWEPSNHASRCQRCNAIKAQRDEKGPTMRTQEEPPRFTIA